MNVQSEIDSDEAEKLIACLRSFAAVSGWRVTSCDKYGVEFVRPKTYSRSTLIGGGVLLIIGIGLLLLIWGIFEYLTQSDEVLFIPMRDILDKKIDTDQFKWR